MHFEILVEDQSGGAMLKLLVPKIVDQEKHTFRVVPFKGIGHIPKKQKSPTEAGKKLLLSDLPKILKAYGKGWRGHYEGILFVICDLDDKCLKVFRGELQEILDGCYPAPKTRFCFAIEEGEAWLLGDIPAIKKAYPKAMDSVLNEYKNDSICGTWEKLADAIYKGGASALSKRGWQSVGMKKSRWAEKICPHMDVEKNRSPSFIYFRDKLRKAAAGK